MGAFGLRKIDIKREKQQAKCFSCVWLNKENDLDREMEEQFPFFS